MIILASQSPRRRELLALLTKDFIVVPSGTDEACDIEDPRERVCFLSAEKAREVAMGYPGDIVLGADTVVACAGQILEKPEDREDAERMIRLLAGRDHTVYTGVTLAYHGKMLCRACATKVTFAPMTEEEIQDYARTEDVLDKAGAYAIQGGAAKFITGIEGDFFNVVGLPVRMVYEMLEDLDNA